MSTTTVKAALTPHLSQPLRRPRVERGFRPRVENDDYAAFTRRVLAAHGCRIAAGDVEGLATLARLATDVDAAIHTAVTGLRAAGYSWAEIADRLGVTRQAAHQRWHIPTTAGTSAAIAREVS